MFFIIHSFYSILYSALLHHLVQYSESAIPPCLGEKSTAALMTDATKLYRSFHGKAKPIISETNFLAPTDRRAIRGVHFLGLPGCKKITHTLDIVILLNKVAGERLFAVHGLSERTTVQTSSLLLRLFFLPLGQPDPTRPISLTLTQTPTPADRMVPIHSWRPLGHSTVWADFVCVSGSVLYLMRTPSKK